MSYIILNVEEPIAKAFNEASGEEKNELVQSASYFIKRKLLMKNTARHKEFLDGLSDEAQKNGLTPAILEELLREHE